MNDYALLSLRLAAGIGLATHGYTTIVDGGMEAIEGFAAYLDSLNFPRPTVFAWAAKASELVGGALVALGLLTRPAAFMCAITMLIAMLTAHMGEPFAKWELALLYFAIMIALTFSGAGKYSLDARRR